jgi:hypothetical protein
MDNHPISSSAGLQTERRGRPRVHESDRARNAPGTTGTSRNEPVPALVAGERRY